MAFGGGSFVTQNKILPGVYVNVNQQGKAGSVLSDRGVAALGLELDWGPSCFIWRRASSAAGPKACLVTLTAMCICRACAICFCTRLAATFTV